MMIVSEFFDWCDVGQVVCRKTKRVGTQAPSVDGADPSRSGSTIKVDPRTY